MGPPVHRAGNCGFLSVDSTSLPHWNRSPTQEKSFSFNWRPFFCFFCVCVCVCVCVCTPTEWRQLRGGSLILTDEDEKTKVINGWKRLNTLAHYGVKDSAVMSLVPRRPPTCTLNNGHCKASYRNCESFQILDPVFIPLNSPFPCSMKSLPTLIRFGQTRFLLDISLFFLDCRFFRCGTNF